MPRMLSFNFGQYLIKLLKQTKKYWKGKGKITKKEMTNSNKFYIYINKTKKTEMIFAGIHGGSLWRR